MTDERWHTQAMSVARRDEYRAALRDHRSWPLTVFLFVAGGVAWLIGLALLSALWLHMPMAVLLTLSVIGGIWAAIGCGHADK